MSRFFWLPLGPRSLATYSASSTLLALHQTSSHAAWDLQHSWAVEDLLRAYLLTLPQGGTVAPPRLMIYAGTAFSRACPKSGIDSPAYCSGDHTVYLETGLGDEVADKFGDFGALAIIAHEFGHAYLTKLNQHPQGKEGELAADRFAGGFARFVKLKGLLERGDIEEARATFAAVGDYKVYHHDHHGTPVERLAAFDDGYLQGFRLPGEAGASQPQAPVQPTAEQSQPSPPAAPPSSAPSQALPVLGLGLTALLAVGILSGVISLVKRARGDDF